MADSIFHPDFIPQPWWWEAIRPDDPPPDTLPPQADVVIVGGGLTGLNCALELARAGARPLVLEADSFGFGASSRNGGAVSAGTNLGKGLSGARGRGADPAEAAARQALMADAAGALTHVETVISREGIACHWRRSGRFVGAFTPRHYAGLLAKLPEWNGAAEAGAEAVPREQQHEEIASDYYHGGVRIARAGQLHPALYSRGLADAAARHGAVLAARTRAGRLQRAGAGWRVETDRGTVMAAEVVIATNGYTGGVTPDLRRRLIPLASHIIATEELDPALAASLVPRGRTISDTRRVLCYYRLSPDGRRVLFGGRPRFTDVGPQVTAPALHALMLERWPQLRGTRITHAWTGNTAFTFDQMPHLGRTERGLHYAMGCNGSGVAILSHLGAQLGRKLLGGGNQTSAFDGRPFPTRPFYTGDPWFLPAVGSWYRFRDWLDRRLS